MSDEESEIQGPDLAEAVGVAIMANATVKTWEDSTLIDLPDGAILTLLHNIPVHDSMGEIINVTKQPVAYYRLQSRSLLGISRMFIRQTLLWAAEHADEDTLLAGREALQLYITEAMDEYSNRQQQERDQEAESGDDNS